MFKKIAAAAATLALAGTAVVATSLPAAAADDWIEVESVKVVSEPLKLSGKSKVTVTVDFLGSSSGYVLDEPWVEIESDTSWGWASIDLKATSRGDIWRGTTYVDNNEPAGKWWVHVRAWADFRSGASDYVSEDFASSFQLKRSTQLSLDASPEPVAKGRTITVKGTLKGLVGDYSMSYRGYANQPVKIYFDPKGSQPKRYAGTVTTNSKGQYAKKYTAKQDGVWSAVFAGNSRYVSKTSAGDFVDVR